MISLRGLISAERQLGSLLLKHWQISSPVFTQGSGQCAKDFHSGPVRFARFDVNTFELDLVKKRTSRWLSYNKIIYPPQMPGEPKRPAEICHSKSNIKHSEDKMWYIAGMVRGMTIDEAVKQLSFNPHKAGKIIKGVLLEAQSMAVDEFNVEFKSNLWIEESYCTRCRLARYRSNTARGFPLTIRLTTYHVRLSEGKPPKHYFPPEKTGFQKMEEYLRSQRNRRVKFSL